jgi:putative ABC transport system permease protein
MLRLENIVKDYKVADYKVRALKGVSLSFRKNEFVSVLGPSGCGKTTLLNLIGGLDKYTSGDLHIGGRSTKDFKDKDWDIYRNHKVGFIFQAYNLIPHLTVLGNVELSLTIAGLNKAERVEKAKRALDKVGLSDQYNKRPNQLSGGQSQRVAIARALVNDPDILLADEPTGALDTKTSVQIMDLVQEIAKERLVIMVTHNAELAAQYSTRIIRLLDGELQSDSNPFDGRCEMGDGSQELDKREEIKIDNGDNLDSETNGLTSPISHLPSAKKARAKMSFFTAFKLSLKNLISKKARTTMTAIAGSIGIIGISVVLSFSIGIQGFVTRMQGDMLSGSPITITRQTFNMNAMMQNTTPQERQEIITQNGFLNINGMVNNLVGMAETMNNLMITNEITEDYVRFVNSMPQSFVNEISLDFGLNLSHNLYTDFKVSEDGNGRPLSLTAIQEIYATLLMQIEHAAGFSQFISMLDSPMSQSLANQDYVLSQYEMVEGRFPTAKNEIMLVVNRDHQVNDLLLAQLGFLTQDEFMDVVHRAIIENEAGFDEFGALNPKDVLKEGFVPRERISHQEIMNRSFFWYPNDTVYNVLNLNSRRPFEYRPDATGFGTPNGMVELKVVGILEPQEHLNFGSLQRGFFYTPALAEHIVATNYDSAISRYIREDRGNAHTIDGAMPGTEIRLTQDGVLTSARATGMDDEFMEMMIQFVMAMLIMAPEANLQPDQLKAINAFLQSMQTPMPDQNMGIFFNLDYTNLDGEPSEIKNAAIGAAGSGIMGMFAGMFGMNRGLSLQSVGGVDIPSSILIFSADIDQAQNVRAHLDRWNSNETLVFDWVDQNGVTQTTTLTAAQRNIGDGGEIEYTDMLSLVMDMVRTFINIITIALIGFTSLALVVSCVMIAIITYVSVVERVREIGVIRSLGGRKRDVASLFTAETFIIGLASGLIGIIFTYIVTAIVNLIVYGLISINIASFPPLVAFIMVSVSIILTLISGLLPSRSAARKDPVVALRTE